MMTNWNIKKIIIGIITLLLIPTGAYASYKKLADSKYMQKYYTQEKLIPKAEKAVKKRRTIKYLGRMSEDKVNFLKEYGCPDVIGKNNITDSATKKYLEEWIYLPEQKLLYFQRKDGSLSEERRMSLLDVLSFEGTLALGMNKEQVMRIKGRPLGKRKNKGPWGLNERWWYKKEYLYFENDKLVSWLKK